MPWKSSRSLHGAIVQVRTLHNVRWRRESAWRHDLDTLTYLRPPTTEVGCRRPNVAESFLWSCRSSHTPIEHTNLINSLYVRRTAATKQTETSKVTVGNCCPTFWALFHHTGAPTTFTESHYENTLILITKQFVTQIWHSFNLMSRFSDKPASNWKKNTCFAT